MNLYYFSTIASIVSKEFSMFVDSMKDPFSWLCMMYLLTRSTPSCNDRTFDSFFTRINNVLYNICHVHDNEECIYFCIEVVVPKHESYMFNTLRHFDNEAAVLFFCFLVSFFVAVAVTCAPFLSPLTIVLRLHMYVHVFCIFILDAFGFMDMRMLWRHADKLHRHR